MLCHLDRRFGDIDGGDLLGGDGGVEGKRSRVGKAVEHPSALCDLTYRQTVILLVKEESGLLSFDIINVIENAVLRDPDVPSRSSRSPSAR